MGSEEHIEYIFLNYKKRTSSWVMLGVRLTVKTNHHR